MKGITILLGFVCLIAATNASKYPKRCPREQALDWTIEQLLVHRDCSKFYKCTYGKPVEQNCPAGLYFNTKTWRCDWADETDCTGRWVPKPKPTPSPKPTPKPKPQPTPTPEESESSESNESGQILNECPSEQQFDWTIEQLLGHPDCSKFYKCANGVPVEFSCPAGLLFNIKQLACDYPENTECGDRLIPGQESSESESSESESSESESSESDESSDSDESDEGNVSENGGNGKPNPGGNGKPNPGGNGNGRPQPGGNGKPNPGGNGNGKPQPGGNGKPNPGGNGKPQPGGNGKPNPGGNGKPQPGGNGKPNPGGKPQPGGNGKPKPGGNGKPQPGGNGKPKPKPEETTPVLRPNGCPVKGNIHWLIPHAYNCNKFYYCVWGKKVLRRCPRDLQFNSELQVCDWSWEAGCSNKSSFNKHLLSETRTLFEE